MDWSRKRCVVLDMDGTVYLGHIPIKGAVGFIQNHWQDLDFFFLSNNTSKSPQTYVDKLNGMGIPARGELLLSPVTPLVDFLRARGINRAYPVGNSDFQQDLRQRMPELQRPYQIDGEDNTSWLVYRRRQYHRLIAWRLYPIQEAVLLPFGRQCCSDVCKLWIDSSAPAWSAH